MKRVCVYIGFILVCCNSFAAQLTEQKAMKMAQKFQKEKFQKQDKASLNRVMPKNSLINEAFYIFNIGNDDGFMIISSSESEEGVIAYSEHGSFDASEDMPNEIRLWLENFAIRTNGGEWPAAARTQRTTFEEITPLVKTQWHQIAPYNNKCPIINDNHCVTGCAATAMAQVMNYYQWPKSALPPLPGYTTIRGLTVAPLESTIIQWDNMQNRYENDAFGDSADAVAELMRYCGQSVEMDYTLSKSSAALSVSVLKDIFHFSKTTHSVSRDGYSSQEWEELIYSELKAGRPVIYSGQSTFGHDFICDGYDGNGMYHINWGWGGRYDGYYLLSQVNPYTSQIEGETEQDGFCIWQNAIIGLQPDAGEAAVSEVYANPYWLIIPQTAYTRSGDGNFDDVELSGGIISYDADCMVDYAWALYQEGNLIEILAQHDSVVLTNGKSQNVYDKVRIEASIADGEYEIYQMYRENRNCNWRPCHTTLFSIARITGNTLTFQSSDDAAGPLIVNSAKLEGRRRQNRPMKLTLNVTSNEYTHEQPLPVFRKIL